MTGVCTRNREDKVAGRRWWLERLQAGPPPAPPSPHAPWPYASWPRTSRKMREGRPGSSDARCSRLQPSSRRPAWVGRRAGGSCQRGHAVALTVQPPLPLLQPAACCHPSANTPRQARPHSPTAQLTAIKRRVRHCCDVGVAAVLAAQQERLQPQRAQPYKERAQQAVRAPLLLAAGRLPPRSAGGGAGDVHRGCDHGRQLQGVAGGDEPLGARA